MIPVLIILTAIFLSAYGALVGFGGGVFIVPILTLVFHYPIEYAVGAVSLSLIPSALITTILNHRHSHVDYVTGVVLEVPTILGVILGSALVAILPRLQIEYVFVVAISIVGISFLRKKKELENEGDRKPSFFEKLNFQKPFFIKKDKDGNVLYRINYLLATFFGILAGTLAGLFGVGGGFMKTPIMIKVFKIPVKIAAGTALFMIIITSVTSSVSHYLLGHILWQYSYPVAIGFIIGPFIAIYLKRKISSKGLEKLVGFSLLCASGIMLLNIFYIH